MATNKQVKEFLMAQMVGKEYTDELIQKISKILHAPYLNTNKGNPWTVIRFKELDINITTDDNNIILKVIVRCYFDEVKSLAERVKQAEITREENKRLKAEKEEQENEKN
jgi:hypothetical protein